MNSRARKPQRESPHATTTERWALWSLRATTREPHTTTKDTHDVARNPRAATIDKTEVAKRINIFSKKKDFIIQTSTMAALVSKS